ncbi:hypothetical protein JKP88DRAFT_267686 [Tribonema minus]|uniref:Smr domain-containing protein n=1 Tax=Tribonema minus TaxID=303371 RepID=A0A836CIT2_9STRA|nr:hypothetical protein JKP88DRAFT_267686 [Tribonema minus]
MEKTKVCWTEIACGATLRACGKAGQHNTARQLIDKMRKLGVTINGGSYLTLIQHCVRNKDSTHAGDSRGGSEQALEWLQLMEDAGHVPNSRHFTAAVVICSAEGNAVNAIKIFQRMRDQGEHASVQSWSALLDAIGSAGQVDQMMAMYREMRASGQQPNLITMNTMLARAGAAGEVGIAEGIWRELRDLKLVPDVMTYNPLINCYAMAKDPGKAEKVLADMIKSAAVEPNAITFNSVMKAYIEVQRLDDAEDVISRMRATGVQPDLEIWTSIIHAAGALGDIKRADRLYNDALLSGAVNPYRPWCTKHIRDASGNMQPKGTVMDLHGLNPTTACAAIRHELRVRQKLEGASRRKVPLYIITGQGGGHMRADVADLLRSKKIHYQLPTGQSGRIVVPSSQ